MQKILIAFLVIAVHTKLYQVVSMFRHGARYHLNDLYDGNATKTMFGQLTAVGMRQHQNLGKLIRKDYIDTLKFLSTTYNPSEIEVFSTLVNRTVESAYSQLYGIYPLGQGPELIYTNRTYHLPPFSNKTDIDEQNYALPSAFQPIPVKFSSKIFFGKCDNTQSQFQKNINLQITQYKQMNITYYPFMKQMSSIFNIPLASMNFSKISSLYDTLAVDKYLGRPLPSNFQESDYLNLRHLHNWFNNLKISQNYSKALNSFKIQKIINEFDARIRNPTNYSLKWTFLSAHDTDISAAQLDLNISSPQCIEDLYRKGSTTALVCDANTDFASSMIFELHSDNGKDFYVKLRNNGKYVYLCAQKSQSCSYTDWKNRVKKIIISNASEVCGASAPNQQYMMQ